MADGNGRFKAPVLAAAILVSAFPNMSRAQCASPAQPPLLVAAGSLRQAMDEILRAYHEKGGQVFEARYGPSGNLRKEIEAGLKVDAFASASVDHTEALAAARLLGPAKEFTHNDLCIVSRSRLAADAGGLLRGLSDPALRLATSTPAADPMGDYTWQFFRNADRSQPGIYRLLDAKALKLSGSAAPAAGSKPPYVTAFEQDQADAYVMYCTNAVATAKAVPGLYTVRIPDDLNVPGAYGIAAHPSSAQGEALLRFVLGRDGQAILEKYGFH
jgi:molybdenum ABC transporter molybdate-binding protein